MEQNSQLTTQKVNTTYFYPFQFITHMSSFWKWEHRADSQVRGLVLTFESDSFWKWNHCGNTPILYQMQPTVNGRQALICSVIHLTIACPWQIESVDLGGLSLNINTAMNYWLVPSPKISRMSLATCSLVRQSRSHMSYPAWEIRLVKSVKFILNHTVQYRPHRLRAKKRKWYWKTIFEKCDGNWKQC